MHRTVFFSGGEGIEKLLNSDCYTYRPELFVAWPQFKRIFDCNTTSTTDAWWPNARDGNRTERRDCTGNQQQQQQQQQQHASRQDKQWRVSFALAKQHRKSTARAARWSCVNERSQRLVRYCSVEDATLEGAVCCR